MKKSFIIIAAFAVLLSISSCERVELYDPQESGEGIRLTLTCGDIDTKATQPGVGNENLIKTVDVFLFSSSDDSLPYKHHWRFTPEIESNFTCFIQAAVIQNGTYKVYSIVNYPGSETDFIISGTEATLPQLQALALSESTHRTFTKDDSGIIIPAPNEDLALVMTGMADNITVSATSGQTLVGNAEINLSRLPAKVTMDFYLKDEVVNTKGTVTETWTPLTEGSNIRVYLCNGAETAFVGGRDSIALSIFDYEPNLDNTAIPGKTNYSTAFSSAAFYSYPETWDYGAVSEPYLKLIVPWKLTRYDSSTGVSQESQKEFYYKVMLPTNQFESNNWYHLILDVTQLGGNIDDDAVNIPCGYQVLDWRTGSTITSDLSPAYYLDVNVPDPLNIKFYGNELDIPYFASGAVTIRSAIKEWERYSDATHQQVTENTGVSNVTASSLVHISNTLNSDFNGNQYDVSPYKFTVVLGLVVDDDHRYDKTIVVTQYPPLYIEATNTHTTRNNPAKVFVNYKSTTTNGSAGITKVWDDNGNAPGINQTIDQTYQSRYLGAVVPNLTSIPAEYNINATNENPNIYSIATTILQFSPELEGDTFETVLGDPRGSATNEYSTVLTAGGRGSLTNYRPTADNTQNVISPKFISASSYGKTYSVSYEGARKRCAAYQESGYPAGRWRLPTKAEILFLQKLSSDGKIPSLYTTSTTSGYWAAGHLAYLKDASNNDTFVTLLDSESSGSNANQVSFSGRTISVRCVYDTWYWGDAPLTGTGWLGFQTSL